MIKKTLETARRLIAQPEHWRKGDYGWTSTHAHAVDPWNPNADCWCIRGSIYAAAAEGKNYKSNRGWLDHDAAQAMMHVEKILSKYTGWPTRLLANWNDNIDTTHNDVIGLLDRAIAEAPNDT